MSDSSDSSDSSNADNVIAAKSKVYQGESFDNPILIEEDRRSSRKRTEIWKTRLSQYTPSQLKRKRRRNIKQEKLSEEEGEVGADVAGPSKGTSADGSGSDVHEEGNLTEDDHRSQQKQASFTLCKRNRKPRKQAEPRKNLKVDTTPRDTSPQDEAEAAMDER